MKKMLGKMSIIFDRVVVFLAVLGAVGIVFIMLATDTDIAVRYVFGTELLGVLEISEITLLYITFLATAWILKNEGHVKVDLVLVRLKPKTQVAVETVTSIIGTIACGVLSWYAVLVTWGVIARDAKIWSVLGIPDAPYMGIIALGSILLFIQFIRRTRGYLKSWRASSD